jgi:hypothetical protein
MDNPQCHPAGAPAIQANVPKAPSASPVRYQGQLSNVTAGLGRAHNRNPTKKTPAAITQTWLTPKSVGSEAAPGRDNTGRLSCKVRKRRRPSDARSPPMANPNTAVPAPRFPVPTRDQMEVAQPLAHTIPKPNMRPPTTAASQVNGGTGTTRSRASARAFTTTS